MSEHEIFVDAEVGGGLVEEVGLLARRPAFSSRSRASAEARPVEGEDPMFGTRQVEHAANRKILRNRATPM
ncbi:hypothetical protein X741_29155 [Mesorhizobium sp. LNHC229A00]|nr:hypothetical protein X741_29155 [Mesorhizobium sp. LNHC229A00]